MAPHANSNALGVICALGGGVAWGFSGTCAQYVFSAYGLDPVWVIAVRIIVAAVVLMAGCAIVFRERIWAPIARPRDAARIVAFSLFGVTFTQFTYLMAIKASNAGTATMLEYAGPVLVMAFVCVRERRRPRAREAAAVACVAAGVFALATHGNPGQLAMTPEALAWGLLAAFSMLLYTIVPEPLLARFDDACVLAWGMAVGAVIMAAVERPWTDVPSMGPDGWAALIAGLALIGTAGAFALYFHALESIGPARTSLLASMEVVTATALSAVWLETPFTAMDAAGLALIMATAFLLSGMGDDDGRAIGSPALGPTEKPGRERTGEPAPDAHPRS